MAQQGELTLRVHPQHLPAVTTALGERLRCVGDTEMAADQAQLSSPMLQLTLSLHHHLSQLVLWLQQSPDLSTKRMFMSKSALVRGLTMITARQDIFLAVMLLVAVFMMILPLPTTMVDLLIAINLAFSVILLMISIYLRDPLGSPSSRHYC